MFDYPQELQRRIDQFAEYLKKMYHRSHKEVCGSCFMIFSEDSPTSSSDAPALTEAAKPSLELVASGFDDAGIASITLNDDSVFIELPDEGWKEDDSQKRFIQFSFEKNWFCMDMPIQTLYRAEAEKIVRSRHGFFYLRDRPEFTLNEEDVDGYDPFRKVYVYGDEDSAAEDMAFIFFQVWRFPVDWQFYVKASAFGDKKTDWEWGTPIPHGDDLITSRFSDENVNVPSQPPSKFGPTTIEIVPGKSIGPFQFGMTSDEVAQVLRVFTNGEASLSDLMIEVRFDSECRCCELRIQIFNNPNTITLNGQTVSNNQESLIELFAEIYPDAELRRSYACREWPSLGVSAVKWESSDDWIDSLFLVPVPH
jgi:hypothetical protein